MDCGSAIVGDTANLVRNIVELLLALETYMTNTNPESPDLETAVPPGSVDTNTSALSFPAIEGFPEMPFPLLITFPPCGACGGDCKEDFFVPTEEGEAFSPNPNLEFDSEEDISIQELANKLSGAKNSDKTSTNPPVSQTRTTRKPTISLSPKPKSMKKKGSVSGKTPKK